ncbi:unnamed protein product, partial [Leptidea sinapis]
MSAAEFVRLYVQPSAVKKRKPEPLRICRICLVSDPDVKMFLMNQYEVLKNSYKQLLSSLVVKDYSALPQFLCWECARHLTKFNELRVKALKSNCLLSCLLGANLQITPQKLNEETRKRNQLTSTLNSIIFNEVNITVDEEDNEMMIEVLDEEILDENADDEKCVVKEEIGDIFEGDVQNDDNVFQEVQIENDDSQMIPLKDADDESIQYYFVDEENQVKYDAVHDGVKQNKDELKDQKHETNIDTNDNNHEVNDDNVEFDDEYHEIKDEHEFIDDGEIIYEEYIENDDTYMEQDDTQNRMEQNVFSEFGMNTEQTLSYDESEDEPKLRVYDDETKNTFTEVPVTDVIVYSGEMKETEMANIDNKVEKKRKETKEKKEKNKSSDMSTFIVRVLTYDEQVEELEKRRVSDQFYFANYKCNICYKSFKTEKIYERHVALHSESAGHLECDVCRLRFKKDTDLRSHQRKHQYSYQCKLCPYVTGCDGRARDHAACHTGRKFICDQCGKMFDHVNSRLKHMRDFHPSNHICQLCGFSYFSSLGLSQHKTMMHKDDDREVTDDSPQCEHCGLRLVTDEALQTHQRTKHKINVGGKTIKKSKPLGPIQCELCDETFPRPGRYYQHFRAAHPGRNRTNFANLARFMCDACGMFFRSSTTFNDHMTRHTGGSFGC